MIPNQCKTLVGLETPFLEPHMEIIRNSCALQFTGLILNMLIHDQPICIGKKEFGLQGYLEDEGILTLSDELPNVNNFFYPVEYEKEIQYLDADSENEHTITIRAAFIIFRIRTQKGIETFINLSSVFPVGNKSKYENELWRDGMSLQPGDPEEKTRFDITKIVFKNFSLHRVLHEMFPSLKNDRALQDKFNKMFKINSADIDGYDRDIIGP